MGSEVTIADTGEFELIDRITADLDADPRVLVGPGDDAAVLAVTSGSVAVTCDVLVEGQHFRRDWSTAIDIGRKAAAASLADVDFEPLIPLYFKPGLLRCHSTGGLLVSRYDTPPL